MKLYFTVIDGGLYDTRPSNWYKLPALRPAYGQIKHDCANNSHALRAAIRMRCGWPGGYKLFGVTADGGCLCSKCMRSEYRQIAYSNRHQINDGWRVVGIESASNHNGPMYCDHCGRTVVDGDED